MTEEERAFKIIQKLCDNGCKAYITGGVVRDLFLGNNPNDYDVVTEATPEQIERLFYDDKINTVGKSFEVCLINGIEVAGYRKDIYFGLSDKNCKIEPAMTLEEDLGRRDFTINSMAFCPYTNELIDPYGGISDLNNKIIKFTGNPKDRIYEDPCRIIRACRFLCQIDGKFDQETFESLREYSHYVRDYISPERIRLEILKVLKNKKASLFFRSLYNIGALKYIFPSLNDCVGLDGGKYHSEEVFDHMMIVGDSISPICKMTKLAGYLHDSGKYFASTEDFNKDGSFIAHEFYGMDSVLGEMTRLKFSNREIEYVTGLIDLHMHSIAKSKGKGIRKLITKLNHYNIKYTDWLRLKFTDSTGNLTKGPYPISDKKSMIEKFESQMNIKNSVFSIKDLDINGKEVMNILNIKPGPEVGEILRYLYNICLNNPGANQNKILTNIVKFKRKE